MARLRNRTFFSIPELNRVIADLLVELNNKPFQKLPGTRKSVFESMDKPVLKPLPAPRYQFAQWKKAPVHIDYHVEVDGHYYSVPYQLMKKQLDIRITANTVECFYKGKRVAIHASKVADIIRNEWPTSPEYAHLDFDRVVVEVCIDCQVRS